VPGQRPHIGVATCALAPDLDEDGPLLLDALESAGADASVALWDDDAVDWASFDAVLVRSTWDYPLRRPEFLAWSRRCRRTTNPADVLAWNTDKRYLDDLSAAGVPTVPTVFVEPGGAVPRGWGSHGDVVVKPAVGGSAAGTGRFRSPDDPAAVELLVALHGQGRTAMVQPYLPGIDSDGETSLVFLGDRFSHAVRREPLLGRAGVRGAVVVADVLATVRAVEPTAAQLSLADRTLDAVPGGRERLGYARIDVIPGPDGPVLLELEATDCFLFLSFAAAAARARMAEHVVRPPAGPPPR
jgi:glutathione synthase/RimK-type ligase-like ATP-grasp enzyme